MWQYADADVAKEAIVVEQLVVGEDLPRDLLGRAYEQVALWRAAGVELGATHRRPAALAPNAIHHLRVGPEELVGGALGTVGDVHVRVDADRRARFACAVRLVSMRIVALCSLLTATAERLTVQLDQRRETSGS